jgi:Leucine-rich repeat (LRR) protein
VATLKRLISSKESSSSTAGARDDQSLPKDKRNKRKGLHLNDDTVGQMFGASSTATASNAPPSLTTTSTTSKSGGGSSSSTNSSASAAATNSLSKERRTVSTVLLRCNGIHLDFSNFQLQNAVPDTAEIADNLISLDLSHNLFSAWPVLSPFVTLLTLDLSFNQLERLPDSFGSLTNLRSLFLNSNRLEALPESITQLVHLEKLSLANNNLSELCVEIGQLVKLEVLNLSGNRLSSLPPEIVRNERNGDVHWKLW